MEDVYRSAIRQFFADGGPLARRSKTYAPREGQIEMAEKVLEAITSRRFALIEGPTGIGKSFGYLVPALANSVGWVDNVNPVEGAIAATQRRVVVATANINLQHQLVEKDLPLLQKAFAPSQVGFRLCKGASNFFCELEYNRALAEGEFDDLTPDGKRHLAVIQNAWGLPEVAGVPKPSIDGLFVKKTERDKARLPEEPLPEVWSRMSTDAEGCVGPACPHLNTCPYAAMRSEALSARVVVVNYHLLFANVMASGNILGSFDTLICDEAHEMADIARSFFGATFSVGTVKRVLRRLKHEGYRKTTMDLTERFLREVKDHYYQPNEEGIASLREPIPIDATQLIYQFSILSNAYLSLAAQYSDVGRIAQAKADAEYANAVAQRLYNMVNVSDPSFVYYVEVDRGRTSLVAKPVRVDGYMQQTIFSHGVNFPSAVILTSATLSDGESFDLVKTELGLHGNHIEHIAKSPFDLSKQCAVFFDITMPAPTGDTRVYHMNEVASRLVKIIIEARGRTLALFTSRDGMQRAYDRVTTELTRRGIDYPVYLQGTYSKSVLLQRFKEETNSVLFGLESFWAGVDVPGESLSCLVIDKLPFPSPDDPVLERLKEIHGGGFKGFLNVIVPRAVIAMRQGYGRLIRAVDDFGVLVFLDPRLITSNYGSMFTRGLQGVPYLTDLSRFKEAIDFFDERRVVREGVKILLASEDENEAVHSFL